VILRIVPGECFRHVFTGIGPHYLVALTQADEDRFLWIATFTTLRTTRPRQCIVSHEDCPFLTHDSVVLLSKARRFPASALGRALSPMTPACWQRILQAAEASDELPEDCRKAMVAQGLIAER
jgi:hypothetical protein